MSDNYNPKILIDVIKEINAEQKGRKILLQMVGLISEKIKKYVIDHIPYEVYDTVPHHEVIKFQKGSDALLVVIPQMKSIKGILPGKVFEYLASEKPIIGLGPIDSNLNEVLQSTNTGKVFNRSQHQELKDHIISLLNDIDPKSSTSSYTSLYSREHQAKQLLKLITSDRT